MGRGGNKNLFDHGLLEAIAAETRLANERLSTRLEKKLDKLPQSVLRRDRGKLRDVSTPNFSTFEFSDDVLSFGFGELPKELTAKLMSDGRMASQLIEALLATHLGLEQPENTNEKWDLHKRGRKHKSEVRCLTNHGVRFTPSGSVGSGRGFDEQALEEKLDLVAGYYVADITPYPEVDLFTVPSDQVRAWYRAGKLGKNAELSRQRARDLLEGILPPPELEKAIETRERREQSEAEDS